MPLEKIWIERVGSTDADVGFDRILGDPDRYVFEVAPADRPALVVATFNVSLCIKNVTHALSPF